MDCTVQRASPIPLVGLIAVTLTVTLTSHFLVTHPQLLIRFAPASLTICATALMVPLARHTICLEAQRQPSSIKNLSDMKIDSPIPQASAHFVLNAAYIWRLHRVDAVIELTKLQQLLFEHSAELNSTQRVDLSHNRIIATAINQQQKQAFLSSHIGCLQLTCHSQLIAG